MRIDGAAWAGAASIDADLARAEKARAALGSFDRIYCGATQLSTLLSAEADWMSKSADSIDYSSRTCSTEEQGYMMLSYGSVCLSWQIFVGLFRFYFHDGEN